MSVLDFNFSLDQRCSLIKAFKHYLTLKDKLDKIGLNPIILKKIKTKQ